MLQSSASETLTAISITMAPGGRGSAGWDGLANDYVVTAMPGLREGGVAKCTRISSPSPLAAASVPPAPRSRQAASGSGSRPGQRHRSGQMYGPGQMYGTGAPLSAAVSTPVCTFEIKTDWNSDDYASGGLELHYCLNSTQAEGGCGCERAAGAVVKGGLPPTCIRLVDHNDGTYTGAIDPATVGSNRYATFRFFQRVTGTAALNATRRTPASAPIRRRMSPTTGAARVAGTIGESNGTLREIVIGMWADGSDCVGGKPDRDFQSRGRVNQFILFFSPIICSRALIGYSDPSVFSRGGTLVPSSYSDGRYIDD